MQVRANHLSLVVIGALTCAVAYAATEFKIDVPLGLVTPKIPADNPMSQDKVDLGKKLFFDTSLSFNGKVACATCHIPEHGFADITAIGFTSAGGQLQRNTPTMINAALNDFQFWDGRAASLEAQVADVARPGGDTSIHINTAVDIIEKNPEYLALFQKAFDTAPNTENFCQAISAYERTMLSGDTRFDRYLFKGDDKCLTSSEKKGYDLFMGKGNCSVCHTVTVPTADNPGSATFIDNKFHNLGIGSYGTRMHDAGRYLVTGKKSDFGAFKTPTLRNVALTSPYMHDGSLTSLDLVVEFYDKGGHANPYLDKEMKPLNLTMTEKADLVAFLKTLSDENLSKLYLPPSKIQQRINKVLTQ